MSDDIESQVIKDTAYALSALYPRPFGSPVDCRHLTKEYQEQKILEILTKKETIKKRFIEISENPPNKMKDIEDFFKDEEDCFELRVAKSKLFPLSNDLYCHGTSLYLLER